MTDRDALLAAIAAEPLDDTRRLVFADWLEEHDEPDRAALVRLHIEHARHQDADTPAAAFIRAVNPTEAFGVDWSAVDPEVADYCRVRAALERLWAARWREWAAGRTDHWHDDRVAFEGWAPVGLNTRPPRAVAAAAADIAALGVRVSLGLRIGPGDDPDEFARSGVLRHARTLFCSSTRGDPAEVLRWLGRLPDLGAVTTLELRESRAAGDLRPVSAALAGSRVWASLRGLRLALRGRGVYAEIDEEFVAAFTDNPAWGGLERLELSHMLLRDRRAAERLVRGLPNLRSLGLPVAEVTDEVGAAIAAADLPRLRSLDLHEHRLTDPRIAAEFLTAPRWAGLAVLNLGNTGVLTNTPTTLAGLGRRLPARGPDRELRLLNLRSTRLEPEDTAGLARSAAARGLWWLNLHGNAVGLAGAKGLAGGSWRRLAALDLGDCGVMTRAARALAGSPALATLQWLDLGRNDLGPDGCKALAHSQELRGLRRLRLDRSAADKGAKISLRRRLGDGVEFGRG